MVEGLAVLGERDEAARPARILIDRNALGDREKAREPLTETIAMHRQIGMRKNVEMAEALPGGFQVPVGRVQGPITKNT
jgi:hypothetical protein